MLEVKVNSKAVDRLLSVGVPKQAHYALAQALNDTVKSVQSYTLHTILPDTGGGAFKVRTRWAQPGMATGFNAKFAKTSQADPTSVLGSRADWLPQHETGGTKKAGHGNVAIPTTFWKRREELMVREKKPRAILSIHTENIRDRQMSRLYGLEQRLQRIGAGAANRGEHYKRLWQETRDRRWLEEWKRYRKAGSEWRARVRRVKRMRFAQIQKNIGSRKLTGLARASLTETPFVARVGAARGIWVRSSKARLPIHKLFTFSPSTQIQETLDFIEQGSLYASLLFPKVFVSRFVKALSTAR